MVCQHKNSIAAIKPNSNSTQTQPKRSQIPNEYKRKHAQVIIKKFRVSVRKNKKQTHRKLQLLGVHLSYIEMATASCSFPSCLPSIPPGSLPSSFRVFIMGWVGGGTAKNRCRHVIASFLCAVVVGRAGPLHSSRPARQCRSWEIVRPLGGCTYASGACGLVRLKISYGIPHSNNIANRCVRHRFLALRGPFQTYPVVRVRVADSRCCRIMHALPGTQ